MRILKKVVFYLKTLKKEPVIDSQNKNGEDWPEELKYVERLTDGNEVFFGLNLYAHNRAEIDYSTLCLETVDLWLGAVGSSSGYSSKQNIAITSVLKGRRLLRAAQLQIFKGYLPEAEILYRSIFEMQLVISYILSDLTDGRAKKYLTFEKKKIWDFRTLCEDLLGKGSYDIYASLSQYSHPFNLGRERLLYQGSLQPSAIHDYECAGRLLVVFGDSSVALCEKVNSLFIENIKWNEKHQEIYDTEIFKKNFKNVQKMIDDDNDLMKMVLSKSEEIQKRTTVN